jgi:hypothetical protein
MDATRSSDGGVTPSGAPIPPVTILIEWENAQDVEDRWVRRALTALQDELERQQPHVAQPVRVMYLYDEGKVTEDQIRRQIGAAAPRLGQVCTLEFQPTPGLTYYKLKNRGVALARTDLVAMLDSDAAPQPGWLPALLAPFADLDVMAVGGFTVLGYDNMISKVMALTWIFDLRSERERTLKNRKIHANNCAFRTAFFRANPWPDLPTFKKQCGFWLRDIDRRGIHWVRTADAMTVHAPHPGVRFLAWRAWTAGTDRDYQVAQTMSDSRLYRLRYALKFWVKKLWRTVRRVVGKGHQVDLPAWQWPAAVAFGWTYWSVMFVAEVIAASTRRYEALPRPRDVAQYQ